MMRIVRKDTRWSRKMPVLVLPSSWRQSTGSSSMLARSASYPEVKTLILIHPLRSVSCLPYNFKKRISLQTFVRGLCCLISSGQNSYPYSYWDRCGHGFTQFYCGLVSYMIFLRCSMVVMCTANSYVSFVKHTFKCARAYVCQFLFLLRFDGCNIQRLFQYPFREVRQIYILHED